MQTHKRQDKEEQKVSFRWAEKYKNQENKWEVQNRQGLNKVATKEEARYNKKQSSKNPKHTDR